MRNAGPEPSLALLPEVQARRWLSGATLRLRILRPPYPALGVGTLRVLRVAEYEEGTEIVAGYERYATVRPGSEARGG